ncbi:MAG: aminotransferase class V-fold PLP-dependent enzyme [Proteobacteria bacterium]|nr:aminotransferase class V-fold PLP-dependent enzyme [Pseudomonadota bacterium]
MTTTGDNRTEHIARLGDRSLFPALDARAYLNHAAVSPPSLAVREAVRGWLDDYGRCGVDAFLAWNDRRLALRQTLAGLIGAQASDLALIASATTGVIDIALCLPWQRGDRIIGFRGEFPANVTPWQRAAELYQLDMTLLSLDPFMRSHAEGLAVLDGELGRGARLVAVSAVQFQTGLRMPLADMAALCHRHGAELFVDAIQACGAVPIDVVAEGIDYLTCGGHKWLMGVEGTGFLYIAPHRINALTPHLAGWLSHEDAVAFLGEGPGHLHYDRPLKRDSTRFEIGSFNGAGFAALHAAVDLIASIGVPAIYRHVNAYLDPLETALNERGFRSLRASDPAARSAQLGVLPPPEFDVLDIHRALTRRKISCAIPDGVLRFAPHWPNHADEVDVIVAALDEALAELRHC